MLRGNRIEQNTISESGEWDKVNSVYQEPFVKMYSHLETLATFNEQTLKALN